VIFRKNKIPDRHTKSHFSASGATREQLQITGTPVLSQGNSAENSNQGVQNPWIGEEGPE